MGLLLALRVAEFPVIQRPGLLQVALLYFAICAVIAFWAIRRTRTAEDYFVAGRGIGLWTLAIGAMAAALSGFGFIGGPGLVYSLGIGAVFLILPASITNSLTGWVLAKRLRLLGEVRSLLTIPDAIGARYRSPALQGFAALSILVATIGYLGTNILALGLVLDALFHTGVSLGVWIGAAIILIYTAPGGILSGLYTDLFQGAVMALASLLVFLAALSSGGGMASIAGSIQATDPAWFGPWGKLPPLAALSFFFVFSVGALGQPHVLHKFYMLKDPRRLRWYPALMTAAMLMALLLFFGVGLAMKAAVVRGDLPPLLRPDEATPRFLLRYASPVLAGVVFSGVTAAIMSTTNSFLSIAAAAVTRDLPVAFGRVPTNVLGRGRIATVLLTVMGVVLALQSGAVVALLGVFGWGLFASTLVPALGFGLCWPGATRRGAAVSIGAGLTITLVGETLVWAKVVALPAGVSISGLGLVISLLLFFAVSFLDRSNAAGALDPDVLLIMEA